MHFQLQAMGYSTCLCHCQSLLGLPACPGGLPAAVASSEAKRMPPSPKNVATEDGASASASPQYRNTRGPHTSTLSGFRLDVSGLKSRMPVG